MSITFLDDSSPQRLHGYGVERGGKVRFAASANAPGEYSLSFHDNPHPFADVSEPQNPKIILGDLSQSLRELTVSSQASGHFYFDLQTPKARFEKLVIAVAVGAVLPRVSFNFDESGQLIFGNHFKEDLLSGTGRVSIDNRVDKQFRLKCFNLAENKEEPGFLVEPKKFQTDGPEFSRRHRGRVLRLTLLDSAGHQGEANHRPGPDGERQGGGTSQIEIIVDPIAS